MSEKEKKNTRQRILDAATALFAQKGYHAVGIREITKIADVNIAMVNYHFGGKIGILKEIINIAYEKHQKAISEADIRSPVETHIHLVIKNYIDFFRDDTALALVAFDTIPFDIPEIIELKLSWAKHHMQLLSKLFDKLGLNLENKVHSDLFNGLLGNIILTHFRGRYSWEMATQQQCTDYNDDFYEEFTQTLTDFYINGIKGVTKQKHDQEKTKKSR
ncbi:TetR/AcrR family transcriptional regulator [candidate division WOR-3 bacterium]|nr:TetR/AcrR family transcriptional regulator [candidate division WOR-3 bacterium]